MDPFEYVVVLTSLIVGLGIAQILTGIADVISNLKKTKLYLPHILYTLAIFFLLIQEWWINYQYASEITSWTLMVVISIIAYPILLFVMARMIFPTGIRGNETDFKKYYYDQWRYLFTIGITTVIVSITQNIIISDLSLFSQWPQFLYGLTYLAFVTFNIQKPKAHLVFQIIVFAVTLALIIMNGNELMAYL
ncbi:hypothetical protein [Fulvivirga lutimaris]|uniref:hypothetical protein n=1 Tax=Fulvivirga lutimaris TaxID=1819566 RepID=UPI0012BC86BB|nr:hypothetical protein [Fulvivirga lutimaris]MTI39166.1 hypothetical protein [Fulvivirga lutimaris]